MEGMKYLKNVLLKMVRNTIYFSERNGGSASDDVDLRNSDTPLVVLVN